MVESRFYVTPCCFLVHKCFGFFDGLFLFKLGWWGSHSSWLCKCSEYQKHGTYNYSSHCWIHGVYGHLETIPSTLFIWRKSLSQFGIRQAEWWMVVFRRFRLGLRSLLSLLLLLFLSFFWVFILLISSSQLPEEGICDEWMNQYFHYQASLLIIMKFLMVVDLCFGLSLVTPAIYPVDLVLVPFTAVCWLLVVSGIPI